MCHAVVSRYVMNEELCVEGVAMLSEYLYVNLHVLLGYLSFFFVILAFFISWTERRLFSTLT